MVDSLTSLVDPVTLDQDRLATSRAFQWGSRFGHDLIITDNTTPITLCALAPRHALLAAPSRRYGVRSEGQRALDLIMMWRRVTISRRGVFAGSHMACTSRMTPMTSCATSQAPARASRAGGDTSIRARLRRAHGAGFAVPGWSRTRFQARSSAMPTTSTTATAEVNRLEPPGTGNSKGHQLRTSLSRTRRGAS
jgi:hypothetical protein